MINTKIYKAVYTLSEKLMAAANDDNRQELINSSPNLTIFALTMKIQIKTIQSSGKHLPISLKT